MHSPADPSAEAALVARIRAGDERVFRELFERYNTPLILFADRIVHAPDIAEDVVADTFMMVWETRADFTPHHTVQSYLYRVVRNRALNLLRGQRREAARLQALEQSDDLPGADPDVPAIDETLQLEERARILGEAIERLPEPRRTIVMLRWQRGLSFEEIADAVESTPAAVKMQMSRAFKLLREYLPDLLS